jgi:radical SAM protein with 4Fe4S-binding SPASM domain
LRARAGLPLWQLHPQARLRRTPSGGAVFLPDTVTTVELDAEAFAALWRLSAPQSARDLRPQLAAEFQRSFTLAEIDLLLRELAARKVLRRSASGPAPVPARPPLPVGQSAPESIHLQLNNTCNLRCPSCYLALSQQESPRTLPLERLRELLDEWAAMGVFQLALGGGEVLMSTNFAPVVRLARQRGLVPNATTNGRLISEALLDRVQGSLGEMRLSLNDAVSADQPLLAAKAALMRRRGQRFGFNLIVTRQNLDRLVALLSWACAQGPGTVNLIRPHPAPGNQRWYRENALRGADAARLAAVLRELEPLFARTALSVDCAFSFLLRGQPAPALRERAVAGCAMGERFATIQWNGDVYPCSHLRGPRFRAGNVQTQSFRAIWEHSEVFTRLRRDLARVGGRCGACAHRFFCKGCRALVWQQTGDWLAADVDCPAGGPQAVLSS